MTPPATNKPKTVLNRNDAEWLENSSTIRLQNTTVKHLQELSNDIQSNNNETYDDLIVDLIKLYRKKKGLGPMWGGEWD